MPGVRDRRLLADYEKVSRLVSDSGGTLSMTSNGRPPSSYTITFHCRGITNITRDRPVYGDVHAADIELPISYPMQAPLVRFRTPIFHPHVFANKVVCIGAWTINEQLDQLILRLGAIIQGDPQYFNFNSPADVNAAEWARRNMSLLPVGRVTFKRQVPEDRSIGWRDL